ncbi:3-hydroxybutyrate dehydrogenase [Simiduia aestuariiviva]|uniref:3-hydroxybutyrate dehydrogenase n=1 Tax=Simiduia aestuariiviva TaxID=1510459 RepID=A0A839ULG0_9GAMM|nr:3-hydroxybutyrate dehydrogenase [Simiduia aestuariiviva]MBB3168682.1 3-hydroxybutyrate dehydrogenase [Simiduia aestuariiviva]
MQEVSHTRPLAGRRALVTGSSSGIGLAIAEALAKAGAAVVVHGLVPQAEGQALAAQIADAHLVPCVFLEGDMSNADAITGLIEQAQAALGGLDILVNNAGVQFTARTENFPIERWQSVLNINLTGCFVAIKAALPAMQQQGFGRIVNIASVHGLVASVEKAAYVAAKHGLVGLTKVVALENAEQGITCNAICPGWVDTAIVAKQVTARAERDQLTEADARRALVQDKQPMSRMTAPAAIGDLVRFLCSDSGQTLTGAALPVDGGWTAQ